MTWRHKQYNGENPIRFGSEEKHSWIRNLYIKNAKHAIHVTGLGTEHSTIQDSRLEQFVGRTMLQGSTDGFMGTRVGDAAKRCQVCNTP